MSTAELPSLRLADWLGTCETLHRWTQIVGKIRLALAPPLNHWWHVPLLPWACGLTTGPLPADGRRLEIRFDFRRHELQILAEQGPDMALPLRPQSVAAFYRELFDRLRSRGFHVRIWPVPVEIPDATRLDQDERHASYDAAAAGGFWRVLCAAESLLTEFAGRFQGKQSPVHFFWGSFDLALTRFSGRRAPPRPPVDPVIDRIMSEAYSHEVMSFGFWPGSAGASDAAFYAYAAPEPEGFRRAPGLPDGASYSEALGEYLLPWEAVRTAPREPVLRFFQSVYATGATLAGWDRRSLDREGWAPPPPAPRVVTAPPGATT